MDTYRDRWQTGQYKGVTFLTDDHAAQDGRRLAVHEFPGRDDPVVEDLGAKAPEYRVNAYFIGEQYDQAAQTFSGLLREPGADWLIHPWLGRVWVRPLTWSRTENNREQGVCTLAIQFAPGGDEPPQPETNPDDAALSAATDWMDVAASEFDLLVMGTDAINAYVSEVQGNLEYLRQGLSLAQLPLTWASQVLGAIGSIQTELGSLIALPGRYAGAVTSLLNTIGIGGAAIGLPDAARPRLVSRLAVASMRAHETSQGRAGSESPASVFASSGAQVQDVIARENIKRDAALRSQAYLAAALQLSVYQYPSQTERTFNLNAIQTAYDGLLQGLPDAAFQAAVTARATLLAAVLAQDLRPPQSRDIAIPLPATVLAHRFGVDEAGFIARNGVRHPLFVSGRVYG